MNCPKCYGKGQIPVYRMAHAHIEGANGNRLVPCDYAGCHAGQVHCCDGLEEDEWTLEFRWIGHNEEIPEGFELANEKESHHTRHSRLVVREYEVE